MRRDLCGQSGTCGTSVDVSYCSRVGVPLTGAISTGPNEKPRRRSPLCGYYLTVGREITAGLIGFRSLSSGTRAAEVRRNPATGAEIQISVAKTVKFTAGKAFKGCRERLMKQDFLPAEDYADLHGEALKVVESARLTAVGSDNSVMTAAYREIGRRIVTGGRERAESRQARLVRRAVDGLDQVSKSASSNRIGALVDALGVNLLLGKVL